MLLSLILSGLFLATPMNGKLTENQTITSKMLGYKLNYRVYLPKGYEGLTDLPVIYLTDGQWYISEGNMPQIIDDLIEQEAIHPVIAVFVDNRDATTGENRRNEQFMGNINYVDFYQKELVPLIDKTYPTNKQASSRAIMGLSLGGLNATFFGAKAPDTFNMLGIQSPALRPVPEIYDLYLNQDRLPLRIFLSTGTVNDTEYHARKLKQTLETKGYKFEYIEVAERHDWNNWGPLLDDALVYFFGTK